jgi:hypothetical protein
MAWQRADRHVERDVVVGKIAGAMAPRIGDVGEDALDRCG